MNLLVPPDALADVRAWLDDPRAYDGRHKQGWESSIADTKASLERLSPRLRVVLEPEVTEVLESIGGLLDPQATAEAERLAERLAERQTARRGKALKAVDALRVRGGQPGVLDAAWADLVDACRDAELTLEEVGWRRDVFRSLVEATGREDAELSFTLRQVLGDSAREIAALRVRLGDVPEPDEWPPNVDAGLSEDDRLALCERAVAVPPRDGRHVVLLAFEHASINDATTDDGAVDDGAVEHATAGSTAFAVGPIRFYDGRRVRAILSSGGPHPASTLAELPEELAEELADPDSWFDVEDLPDGKRTVLARVDLGTGVVLSPVATARTNAESVVALAAFRAGVSQWRPLKGYAYFVDGRWVGTTGFVSRTEVLPLSWPGDRTGKVLAGLDAELAAHLPVSAPGLTRAMQAARWTVAAGDAEGPARLLLEVRVIELVNTWVSEDESGGDRPGKGQREWYGYLEHYLRDWWTYRQALDRLRLVVRESLRSASYKVEVAQAEHDRLAGVAAEVADSWSAAPYKMRMDRVLVHLGWLADVHDPVSPTGRELRDLARHFDSPQALERRFNELDDDFDRLLGLAQRCRNAVTRGGPLVESTVTSIGPFARFLVTAALGLSVEAVLDGKDTAVTHGAIRELGKEVRRRLTEGEALDTALFPNNS